MTATRSPRPVLVPMTDDRAQPVLDPENTASLALHHACGFRTIGVRERLGRHPDRWRDVILIERRSPTLN